MGRGIARLSALALGLMASAGPARAQDEDTQLWIYAVATGEVGERTTLTVDASARWREDRRGDEQQTLRATVMHEVAEGFALGGGVGVFEAGGETEIRPHQQIDLNLGRFTARTRLEERFFDGADQMELRFRQRIRYTLPLGKSASASVDGEYFNLVQTRDRGPNQPRDQWRGRVIVSADVGERFTLGLSYLYIFTPQPGATDLVNHVPQGIITYRF